MMPSIPRRWTTCKKFDARVDRICWPGSELFLHDTPPRLAALRDTATRGSARDLARIAHTLKGSSANLGARRMVALCAELETLCQAETLDNAAGLLGKLEAEFERVRNRLQTRVKAG